VSAPSPLRLRPLEIGDLLDETFRMYRRHFVLFAGLSVLLSIPQAALSGFNYNVLYNTLLQATPGQPPDFGVLTSSLVVYAIALLVTVALIPFSYGAVTYAACESALGHQVTVMGVLRAVLRKYFHILAYGVLIALMVLVFCLIPLWIWIWVNWVVVIPVMYVENAGLSQAFGRSWRLVEGRWWRTYLILFLMFVLTSVVSVALAAFVTLGQTLLMLVVSKVVVGWISGATSVIIGSLVNPILQIAIVLIYFDLRVRKEGLDLFQQAQHVIGPQPAS
jgi:hypothetical protein